MRDLLNYRTTAKTLIKDTSELHGRINDLKTKFNLAEISGDEWRKQALESKVVLDGSLEINKRLEKDLTASEKKVKWNRGFAVGGCGTVLLAIAVALVKVFYFG
jgi:hypothetical protein